MVRSNPVYYIAPSNISITPNANGSYNDLAVYVGRGAKVKVYSPAIDQLGMTDGDFQEWTLSGMNRRLADSEKPYTIYARLPKWYKDKGYLVFAAKVLEDGEWKDKYPYVTTKGLAEGTYGASTGDNWYLRIGDVSLPENGERTVTYDTGILGTDQFNTEWNFDPDDMPLRVGLYGVVDGEDAGPTPYVFFGKSLQLTAKLLEGWVDTEVERFDHWTIERNTGDSVSDAAWNAVDRSSGFGQTGTIILRHPRGSGDDFNGAVSATFVVTAWGYEDSSNSSGSSDDIVALTQDSITIMAETVEKYEIVTSADIVTYNPPTDTYAPEEGVKITIRATDQRGDVFKLTKGQVVDAGLTAWYMQGDSEQWVQLVFPGTASALAEATIPISVFYSQQGLCVRLLNRDNQELSLRTISFLRNGEDSREREWIYLRSAGPITFGTQQHPYPADIAYGEVDPEAAARLITNEKNQDGWVPEGWWDEMHGTGEDYHYEYGCYRDYIRDADSSSSDSEEENTGGHWGDFSEPVIWSYYAEDAVTYRCRWTQEGTEIWQLVGAYTGAYHGTFPLVATLMKRKGSGAEEAVTGAAVITLACEGVAYSKTINADNPTVIIDTTHNPEFITHLNDVELTGLSIRFAIDGENHDFSIPMIREADEDSVKETIDEYGSEKFLRKDMPDEKQSVQGDVEFEKNVDIDGLLTAGRGKINSVKSPDYTGDGMADTGWSITNAYNGHSKMTVDELYVRMKAVFEALEVKKRMVTGGDQSWTGASNVIVRTDYLDASGGMMGYDEVKVPWLLGDSSFLLGKDPLDGIYSSLKAVKRSFDTLDPTAVKTVRCYFLAEDADGNKVDNLWMVNDLVRCQTFNLSMQNREGGVQNMNIPSEDGTHVYTRQKNTFWWRKVEAVSSEPVTIDQRKYHYFDVKYDHDAEARGLNTAWCAAGSDIPCAGDDACQFGNTYNPDRMNVISVEVNGSSNADAPCIKGYRGIYTFDLTKCWWGGETCMKMKLSPSTGYKFYAPLFEFITEYGTQKPSMNRGEWYEIPFDDDDYVGSQYPAYSDDTGNYRSDGYGKRHVRKCYYYDQVSINGSIWLCTLANDGFHWRATKQFTYNGTTYSVGQYVPDGVYDALDEVLKENCEHVRDYTNEEPSSESSAWTLQVAKGDTGQSSFESIVFKRSDTKPNTPTGGNYTSPVPSGWDGSVPAGDRPIWMSSRIFTDDGLPPQQSQWSDPRLMADTDSFDVEFSPLSPYTTNIPAPTAANTSDGRYTGDKDNIDTSTYKWFDPDLDRDTVNFTNMVWMATRNKIVSSAGVPEWTPWTVVLIKGEDGAVEEARYQWNQSATTPPAYSASSQNPGSNWKTNVPNRPGDGYYLWTISAMRYANGTYGTWGNAIRLTGDTGTPGEDGDEREWIYSYSADGYDGNKGQVNPSGTAQGSDTNKNQKDWVPNGWRDNPAGVDVSNKTEYASWRDITNSGTTKTYGAFHSPIVWSHYGERGIDGDGVEYVFARTTTDTAPTITNDTYNNTKANYNVDEFKPHVSGATTTSATDDPVGTDSTNKYEWVSKRTKAAADSEGHRDWEKYSGTMSLWSCWTEDSIMLDLDNEHEDFLYDDGGNNRSGSAVSKATLYNGSNAVAASAVSWDIDDSQSYGVTKGTNASISSGGVLTVSGLTLSTLSNNSAKVMVRAEYPKNSGKYYYAAFTASKSNIDKYDLIFNPNSIPYNPATYSAVSIGISATRLDLSGTKSDVSISTTANSGTIRLFVTYVKSNGGSKVTERLLSTAFSVTPNYAKWNNDIYFELRKYVSSSTSDSSTTGYTIADYETIPITKAENGIPGDSIRSVNIYKWSATSPSKPTSKDIPPSGWSLNDSGTHSSEDYLWMCWGNSTNGILSSDGWQGPVRITGEDGDPGADGTDYEYIYKRSDTASYGDKPSTIKKDKNGTTRTDEYIATTDDFVPYGWEDSPSGVSTTYKYEYCSVRKKENKRWGLFSEPFPWSVYGDRGQDGDGIQYIFKLFDQELTATQCSDVQHQPVKTTMNSNGEWLPVKVNGVVDNNWVDDAPSPTSQHRYCYCSIIRRLNGTWGDYEPLTLWAKYSTDGENVVRLDLDNEMDSILYDGTGLTKMSGNVTTTAYLFDGITDVSGNATFVISDRQGVTESQATISGRVVTVNGLTSDAVVTVCATYKQKNYYAKFTVKKLLGIDKYDLIVSPNAVGVNTSETVSDKAISVEVYRTPANGGARSKVTFTNKTQNEYGLTLEVKDSRGNSLTETTGTSATTTRTFNLTGAMATSADSVSVVLKKNSVTQDTETIPVNHVHNGIDGSGSNAVKIDLDNEMDSIPCDSNGVVMAATTLSTHARIYDGASQVTSGVTIKSVDKIAGVTASSSVSAGVVSVSWTISKDTHLTVDKFTAQIVLTWNDNDYYGTFTATVVKSGMPGVSPTIYQLSPNPSVIAFALGSDGKLPSAPQTLEMKIKETTGTSIRIITMDESGLTVRYRKDQMPTSPTDGKTFPAAGLSVTTADNNIYVAAFSGTTLIDRETIPVTKDGVSPIVFDIDNEMDTVPTDSTGKILNNTTITTIARLYIGNDEVDISSGNVTVSGGPSSSVATLSQNAESGGKGRVLQWAFKKNVVMLSKYDITISKADGSSTLKAVFTVTASKGLAIYQLKPSRSSVVFDYDDTSSKELTVKVVKMDSGTATEMNINASGLTVRYDFSSMPATSSDGTTFTDAGISVPYDKENVYIAMFNSSDVLIDRETVPVIRNGEPGVEGPSGDDGYGVTINPAYAIFEEVWDGNEGSNSMTVDLSGYVGKVRVLEGSTAKAFKITYGTHVGCSLDTANSTPANTSVTEATIRFGGISTDSNGYVKQGYLLLNIVTTDKAYSYPNVRIPFYLNKQGTFNRSITQGVETAIGQLEEYYPTDGSEPTHTTWMYEQINSAQGSITTITKKVNNGKNMLSGVLTANGWKSGTSVSALTTDAKVDGEQWIKVGGNSDTMLKTTLFNIESGKTYKISFDTESTSAVAVNLRKADGTNISSWNSDSGNTHHTTGFEANYTGSVYLVIVTTKLRYPQVEEGNVATAFDAGDREVSSSISQTAEKIELEVSDTERNVSNLTLTVNGLTSTVTKLTDGKNILSGVLTGENWKSASRNVQDGRMLFSALKGVEDYWFIKRDLTTFVASPLVAITEGKTYTLSFDAEGTTAVTVIMYISSSTSETLTTSATSRRSVTFESRYTGNVRFLFQVAKIRYPQLELGDTATEFDANSTEISSQISQTADNIDLTINSLENNIEKAGLHIDGNNSKVMAVADHFEIWNSGKTKKTFSIDSDGNLVGSNNASFKGTVMSGEYTENSQTKYANEFNENGSGHLAKGNISWKANGDGEFRGTLKATSLYQEYQVVTENSTYDIANGTYIIASPVPEIYTACQITIPEASSSNNGVTLTIVSPVADFTSTWKFPTIKINTGGFYTKKSHSGSYRLKSFKTVANLVIKLHSIGNTWFLDTEEDYLTDVTPW